MPVLVPSSAVKGACDDVISNFAVSTISISHAGDGKIPSLDVWCSLATLGVVLRVGAAVEDQFYCVWEWRECRPLLFRVLVLHCQLHGRWCVLVHYTGAVSSSQSVLMSVQWWWQGGRVWALSNGGWWVRVKQVNVLILKALAVCPLAAHFHC